jgi:hypothetical protein
MTLRCDGAMHKLWESFANQAEADWLLVFSAITGEVMGKPSWQINNSPGYVEILRAIPQRAVDLLSALEARVADTVNHCNDAGVLADSDVNAPGIFQKVRVAILGSITTTVIKYKMRAPGAPDLLDPLAATTTETISQRIAGAAVVVAQRMKSRSLQLERDDSDRKMRQRQDARASEKHAMDYASWVLTFLGLLWALIGQTSPPLAMSAVGLILMLVSRRRGAG